MTQAIRIMHAETGIQNAPTTSAGTRLSWFDPSIGQRFGVLQHGQVVRYFDPEIGERTLTVP